MRKRQKQKKRSCSVCKAYKMGRDCRWKNKEFQKLRIAEQSIREQEAF